jgi:glutathione S-transferase
MLTLYHGDTSVCSQKVRVGLAEKGLAYEGRMIDIRQGEQFDPAYMKLNPNAVVPTLVHDGKVVIESSVIVEYLDEVFPENPLMPKDGHLKALIRIWLLRTLDVHASINTMSFATAYRERELRKSPEEREAAYRKIPSAYRAAKKRDLTENGTKSLHFEAAVDVLSRAMRDMESGLAQWEWLVGNSFSLADVGLIPYIDRLYRLGLEGYWTDCPRVADWYGRMRARKSYAEAIEAFVSGAADMRSFGDRAWPEIARLLRAA